MRLGVHHRTSYRFTEPQRRIVQLARLTPAHTSCQHVVSWAIDVDCDARLRSGRDGYGNETTMLYIDGPIEALTIAVRGEVLTEDHAGVLTGAPEPLPQAVFLRSTDLTEADAAITDLARTAHDADHGSLARMHRLMGLLGERMRFDTSRMDVARRAAEALAAGSGVCQDFAHVFVAAARSMGVPARYVSGHLYRRDGSGAQAAAHAWAEACIEDLGWVAFDAANGICADDAYVRVAVGLDYREAAPLAGARVGGGHEHLDVTVEVARRQAQVQTQG
jgi:transglutaminase-like putative cysteine protease